MSLVYTLHAFFFYPPTSDEAKTHIWPPLQLQRMCLKRCKAVFPWVCLTAALCYWLLCFTFYPVSVDIIVSSQGWIFLRFQALKLLSTYSIGFSRSNSSRSRLLGLIVSGWSPKHGFSFSVVLRFNLNAYFERYRYPSLYAFNAFLEIAA